jgi:hypothetical protein
MTRIPPPRRQSNCCASFTLRIVGNAELYLRQAGERLLLEYDRNPDGPADAPLVAAARALVAVGAITAEAGEAIVTEYGGALAYRKADESWPFRARQAPRAASVGPGARRVVPCRRVIERPWGRLELAYLVLSEDETSLWLTIRRPESAPGLPWDIPGGAPALTDNHGTTAATSFSGGGRVGEATGQLTAKPPLALDSTWFEILGQRVDLTGQPVAARAWVEPSAEEDLAWCHLWALVATVDDDGDRDTLRAAAEALIAVGLIAAGDPRLAQVRSVVDGGAAGNLPEQWRSALTAVERSDGPSGLVVVDATTPEFEGITATVLALRSGPREFAIDVEVTPGVWDLEVAEPLLSWWAADDRGRYYRSWPASWGASLSRGSGTLTFHTGLDPLARTLDIMPTTATARAVIRIPLDWSR